MAFFDNNIPAAGFAWARKNIRGDPHKTKLSNREGVT